MPEHHQLLITDVSGKPECEPASLEKVRIGEERAQVTLTRMVFLTCKSPDIHFEKRVNLNEK